MFVYNKIKNNNNLRPAEKVCKSDIERSLHELKKFKDGNKNVKHFKRLLLITKEFRWPEIDAAQKVADILEIYPDFNNLGMVISKIIEIYANFLLDQRFDKLYLI